MARSPVVMKLEGELVALQQLERARLGTRTITGVVMRGEGERIMQDSKENYVPVLTGALQATGRVEGPEESGGELAVELLYGGSGVDYAVTVHETDRAYRNGKSWKYLEIPANNAQQGMEGRMGGRIGAYLEGLFGR